MKKLTKLHYDYAILARDSFAAIARNMQSEGDIVLWQLTHKVIDAIDDLLKENRKRIEAGE
jgi:hypothetical protein